MLPSTRRVHRHTVLLRNRQAHGYRKIAAKGFANRAGLEAGAKPRHLRVVHRMAVFMHDRFAVFGVVAPPLPNRSTPCLSQEYVVVNTSLVNAHILGPHIYRGQHAGPEAQALQVKLGLGDPEAGHHLLKLILVVGIDNGVGWRASRAAGLAYIGVVAPQVAAATQVAERYLVASGRRNGCIGIVLVAKGFNSGGLHRVGD